MAALDWNDVSLFLFLARSRTLSAAALALGISQPTAGRRLRAFEEAMGMALFQRTPNGLQLTGDGEVVLKQAERIETEMLGLLRSASSDTKDIEGELRISTSEWFGSSVLVRPLTAFCINHPAVTVELLGDTRLFDLSRREADMVFRFQKFGEPDVVQRQFARVAYGVFASSAYIESRGPVETTGLGVGHTIIAMDRGHEQLADVPWLRQRFPLADFGFRSNSRDMQGLSCSAGGGIAVLPRVLAAQLGLCEIILDEEPPSREVWLGYHSDLRRVARLRAVIDHLLEAVPREF